MEWIKSNYNIVSITLFIGLIIIAHLFSSDNYIWTKNSISDLAAQGYEKKLIMQSGFLLFGISLMAGILMNGLSLRTLPLFIYGLSLALSGVFCTKPFIEADTYSLTQSNLHSIFAQIAGLAFSIGILVQVFYSEESFSKYIHTVFFVLVVMLSATFGLLKDYHGITQRLLYLISLFWLARFYKTQI